MMCCVKLITFLILLNSFKNVRSDTSTVMSTESHTKSSPTNDPSGATSDSLLGMTSATTDEITTIPTTQSEKTTGSTTPKSGANPTILGKGYKVFVSGSNLSMSCTYNSTTLLNDDDMQKLKFYDKDGAEFDGSRKFTKAYTRNSPTSVTVTLNKVSVDRSDAGRYQCKYDGAANSIYNDVIIVVFDTTPAEYNNTAINLKCKYDVEKDSNVVIDKRELSWKRGDELASKGDRHRDNGTTLIIEKAEWSDIGPYTCELTLTWGTYMQTVSTVVPLNGAPKITKMDSSKNVVQDDDLEIKCPVSGYPYPTVTWKKDGMPLVQTKRITFSMADGKYENAILNINNLEFEDKGEYTCNATSSEYQSGTTASINIRVKDKLAALWPFLGIVAEVIVLCIIIFIYEKKRSREMEDEADGGDDVVNTDDHKGKDVRQRNVRT